MASNFSGLDKLRQSEAFLDATDAVRRLMRKAEDLPPSISNIVELLCQATNNVIEAEWEPLRPSAKRYTDDQLAAEMASMKDRAVQRIETALREIRASHQGGGGDSPTGS